jgi:hypothetical protein
MPLQPEYELTRSPAPPPMEAFTTHPSNRSPAVIADANALISDSIRRSRGLFNIMPFLAERQLVSLLAPEHIDAKVYLRLPEACENAHANLAAATAAYETVHRPLLRLVNVGELMLHDPRVGQVAITDEEDVPVAQLGVLLAPSLVLTRDPHLLDAGIGVREWADALVLLNELAELDMMMWGATAGTTLTTTLAGHGIAGLVRLLSRSEMALGIIIGLALGLGYSFRYQLQARPARVRETAAVAAERLAEGAAAAFERREDADRRLHGTLVRPHDAETPEAAVARVLLRARQPLPAREVHARLPSAWREGLDERTVVDLLRAAPPFELRRGRGWELGHRPHRAALSPADR